MAYSGNSGEKLSETSRRHVLSVAYWRFFVNALLVLCDMAAFIIASAIVYVVRNTGDLYSTRFHFHIALWAYMLVGSLIWIYCLHSVGVYHRHVMGDGYQLNAFLIKGALFAGLMVCALNSILNVYVPLVTTGLALLCALLVTIVERFIIRQCVLFSREKGAYSYGTVVVGSLEGIEHALQFLSRKSQLNYHAIAVCPIGLDAQTGYVKAVDVTAEFKQRIREICGRDIATLPYCKNFAERAASMGVQTVMVTDVMHRFSDNFNTFVLDVEAMNLEVALITSAVDVSGHETNIRVIQGSTVMTISLPQYSPWAMFKKRVFDIVVSLMALVGTAIITIPVAIAIKVTDRGPIFYTQTRVGRRGKPFKMIKFRSMVVNADKMKSELAEQTGQKGRFIFKMKNDPRVTTVGRFIRKFSIDEFPQFLNVFLGQMSVVGPRPPLPNEVAQYTEYDLQRLAVKPGITGWWQVTERNLTGLDGMVRRDLEYIAKRGPITDLKIVVLTVIEVFTGKGAC